MDIAAEVVVGTHYFLCPGATVSGPGDTGLGVAVGVGLLVPGAGIAWGNVVTVGGMVLRPFVSVVFPGVAG